MSYIKKIAVNKNRILNHTHLINKKSLALKDEKVNKNNILSRAGHIELQLTDKCTLNCQNCHFRNLGDHHFNFEWLENIIKFIRPKAITLAGGGEPTIYPQFNDAVLKLSEIPDVEIGLITNGTVIPKGEWMSKMSWIRISVYSIDDGMYSGRVPEFLNLVLNNIDWYLKESGIPHVGVHFLFYRQNSSQIGIFARNIYDRLKQDPSSLKKVHIQFKPAFIMASPDKLTDKLHQDNINLLPSFDDLNKVIADFDNAFLKDEEFRKFCEEKINIGIFRELIGGDLDGLVNVTKKQDLTLEQKQGNECYVCLAYQLIDPNGYIYPCLTLAEHRLKKFSIGHISDLPNLDDDKMNVFHNAGTEFCNKVFCRNWSQNKIVRSYLKNKKSVEVPTDNFF